MSTLTVTETDNTAVLELGQEGTVVVSEQIIGIQGPHGADGPANVLSIGTVTDGDTAAATITGTPPAQVLSLVLPRGATGPAGPAGADAVLPATVPTATNLLWDDVRVSLARANAGGDPPSWSVFRNGVYAQSFAADATQSLMFDLQMPHAWASGTDLHAHVHWSPGNSTNTGSVRWGLEYTWQNIDGAFGPTTTIYVDSPAGGVAYGHQLAEFAPISGAGKKLSSVLLCRLFRVGANAADTFTGPAFALSCDVHYQIDKMGGSTEDAGT